MDELRFALEVIEFVTGPPEGAPVAAGGSQPLAWRCGCTAIPIAGSTYRIVPCAEHRPEFVEFEG